jgi:hypothetical protein
VVSVIGSLKDKESTPSHHRYAKCNECLLGLVGDHKRWSRGERIRGELAQFLAFFENQLSGVGESRMAHTSKSRYVKL